MDFNRQGTGLRSGNLKRLINMELPVFNRSESRLKSKSLLVLLLFLVLSFPALSQPGNGAMDELAGELHSLAKNSPTELVYLQTSKGIYESGEDLWFKAYLLDTRSFIPSVQSQTLYLQVINEKTGQAVWQEKYEARNGFADGHVFLQDTLSEGDYRLAAYTGHSFFNDGAEFTALRKIKVKKDMKPRSSVTADFNRVFYKEGDTIRVKLTALSEKKEPLIAQIAAELRRGNQTLEQAQATTNMQGEASVAFVLHGPGDGLQIKVNEKYADLFDAREKTMSFPVPCKKGSPVQFETFPEGGHLVAGLPCNLAFKAVNIEGNPLDVTGTLFEEDNPLLEFKSAHAGMGSLGFIPVAGKKYCIRLSVPRIDSTFLLPEVHPEGVVMRLAGRESESLEFIVSQSPGRKRETVYLRGQLRGVVYCMATGVLNQELKIKIPLKEFPVQGIAEFTLFNESLAPVAERLVYINPEKGLYIETKLSKEIYETREKATLKITVKDKAGHPVTANLGVNVYDKLYQDAQDPKDILTHCYLTSQLKGRVYDPAYYFDSNHQDREEALNLLLLTQGWRRYVWGAENLKEYGEARPPLIFDGTEGEVHATKKKKEAQAGKQFVMAFNPGKNKNTDLLMTDPAGRFMVSPQQFTAWRGGYIYLKPMAPEEFGPRISLSDPFGAINGIKKEVNYPDPGQAVIKKEESSANRQVDGHNTIKLAEITIKGRGTQIFRDKYMGHLDSLAKLDLNIWVCKHGYLEGYLKGYSHECKDTTRTRPVEGKSYRMIKYEYVGRKDGKKIVTGLIDSYEFHYSKFTEEELLKMNNLSRVKAYYAHREFYQPNYDKETANDLLPDFRNTLLWKPSVVTNEKGEATLEFFCSDINTRFVGKIEGAGGEGLLGTKDFEFAVLKRKLGNPGK
jgi:hypothetical protein